MTKSPTALDVNRRGFLGLLFGAAAAVVVAPLVERVAAVAESRGGALLRKLRGLEPTNSVVTTVALRPADLADAFAQVERWDLPVRQVYVHPDVYEDLLAYGRDLVDEEGAGPKLWGATIHVTDDVSRKEAFVLNSPDDPRGVAEIRVLS